MLLRYTYVPSAFLLYAFLLFNLIQFFLNLGHPAKWLYLSAAVAFLPFSLYTLIQSFRPFVEKLIDFYIIYAALSVALAVNFILSLLVDVFLREYIFIALQFVLSVAAFYLLEFAPRLPSIEDPAKVANATFNANLRQIGAGIISLNKIVKSKCAAVFFRGNWCPSSMAHLQSLFDAADDFARRELDLWVISPQPLPMNEELQRKFGEKILFFQDEKFQFIDALGLRHRNGVPWGASGYGKDTVLPATLLIDDKGDVKNFLMPQSFRRLFTPQQILQQAQSTFPSQEPIIKDDPQQIWGQCVIDVFELWRAGKPILIDENAFTKVKYLFECKENLDAEKLYSVVGVKEKFLNHQQLTEHFLQIIDKLRSGARLSPKKS